MFHVTDDVELIGPRRRGARRSVARDDRRRAAVEGKILTGACRWYAFRVRSLDDSHERTEIVCDVVDRGTLRDFFGFNRAKHAVLEAAILATRTEFLPADEILSQFERLAVAGAKDRRSRRAASVRVSRPLRARATPAGNEGQAAQPR